MSKVENVRLTSRDSEVLLYLLQMKFACIEDLHAKFFRRLKDGSESNSLTYATERTIALRSAGFIKVTRCPMSSRNLYLPTWKAYHAIRTAYYDEVIPKPVGSVDIRTFEHDKLLLKIRNKLENQNEIQKWISERCIRTNAEVAVGMGGTYAPDAILVKQDGTRIAFELELTRKSKARYREKFDRYVSKIRTEKANQYGFQKVIYFVRGQSLQKAVKDICRIYPSYFEFIDLTEFMGLGVVA